MIPKEREYLKELDSDFRKVYPSNKTINIVCHGHSIPCGYTVSHIVKMADAYPRLLHNFLCNRYPTAVTNVIVSAIGGENSISGANRFKEDVLCHKPRLITIDYGRNDMYLNAADSRDNLKKMIETALEKDINIILITPFMDCGEIYYKEEARRSTDEELAHVIKELAFEYEIGLADVRKACLDSIAKGKSPSDYLINVNHPDWEGHSLILSELKKWFPFGT